MKIWGFMGIVKSHKAEKLAEVDLKRSTMPIKKTSNPDHVRCYHTSQLGNEAKHIVLRLIKPAI